MERSPGASEVPRWRVVVLWGLSLLWLASAGESLGFTGTENLENKLKVAFLLNFAKFTSWPANVFAAPQQTFQLCVGKVDPFDGALDGLAGKQVGGRSIQILHLKSGSPSMNQCHLVYLGQTEVDRQAPLLRAVNQRPVLTISDIPGFAEAGGTIEFRRQGDRLAFVVNNHAAKASGLQLSSSLLHLALEVL